MTQITTAERIKESALEYPEGWQDMLAEHARREFVAAVERFDGGVLQLPPDVEILDLFPKKVEQ